MCEKLPLPSNSTLIRKKIEGAFIYHSNPVHIEGNVFAECSTPHRRRYIFFSSSSVIPISPGMNSLSLSPLRDALIRYKTSASSRNSNFGPVDKHFSFTFQLPRSCRPGEQMPPSSTSTQVTGSMYVSYRLKVVWEAANAIDVPSVYVRNSPLQLYVDRVE